MATDEPGPVQTDHEEQFREEVFPDEAEYLVKRWYNAYRNRPKSLLNRLKFFARKPASDPPPDASATAGKDGAGGKAGDAVVAPSLRDPEQRPAATKQLVGLGFSGGGIRSATFNLGIAQSLHKRGVLDHVDYLSTVSGGGYLGSSISTIMRDGGPFPFAAQEGKPKESAYITWLRNHSNYLAERGLIDYLRLFALLLRGIVLNFLIIVPFLLLLALLLDSHYAAAVPCPVPASAPLGGEEPECDRSELGLLNRGILTHWERQVAAHERTDEHERRQKEAAAPEEPAAPAAAPAAMTPEEEAREIESLVEKKLDRVKYLEAYSVTPLLAALFLFYYLLYPVVIRVFKVLQHDATAGNESSVDSRGAYELTFAKLMLAVGVSAALESLPILLHVFHQLRDIGVVRGVAASIAGGSSVIALTLFGRLMQQFKGLTRKILMIVVGFLGMLLPLIFVLYVAETLVWEWHALTVDSTEWYGLALFVGLVVGGLAASGFAKVTGGGDFAEKRGGLRTGLTALFFFLFFGLPFGALWWFGRTSEGGGQGWRVLKVLLCLLIAWAAGLLFEWISAKSAGLRNRLGTKRWLVVALFGLVVLVGCWLLLPSDSPPYNIDSVYLVAASEELAESASAGVSELPEGIDPSWFIVALALMIWLFTWAALDINLTSFHGVYRDRLAEAYLVGVDRDTRLNPETSLADLSLQQIAIEGDLDLADICQRDSTAPYHLVNVAHNLQGSQDPSVRERSSDFFIFSKRFYGGNRTGYARSEELEGYFPQMDLATAMAISAAAAAPNMGQNTNRMLVALMVLLNVRLGYWVPNPYRLEEWFKPRRKSQVFHCRHHPSHEQKGPGRCPQEDKDRAKTAGGNAERARCDRLLVPKTRLSDRFRWRVPPRLIFAELSSALDETAPWINLSDGGHLENLALYELLRRRCKYIIVGDGGGDPNLTFGALANLKRFARIDMGVEIEILLDDLRLNDQGDSYQHAAMGEIQYPEIPGVVGPETGYFLYIKLSVTGDEDEVIREYRARNAAFPHQSTGDQFFDEGQFEAYRALGFHVAEGLFQDFADCSEFEHFGDWFRDLKTNLAPRAAAENLFLELQSDLRRIETLLQDPALAGYFYELNPQLAKDGHPPPNPPATAEAKQETERKLLHVVRAQLRLMENVYVSLDLERSLNWNNDGNLTWRRLLERWSEAPSFRRVYPAAIGQHRADFAAFCARRLGLRC